MEVPNSRLLSTFPIPPQVQSKLYKAGFLTTANILRLRPSELSANAEITVEEAADIIDLVSQSNGSSLVLKTAFQLLCEEQDLVCISTISEKVDQLFGKGIPRGKLVEVSGIAGVGKTQFCLQLCVSVQMPEECGGPQGQAIYIDTEGSFNTKRIADMSESLISHCRNVMNMKSNWDLKSIVENITVFRCREITELISCVAVLKEFLITHMQVKLIIVDSLAFHFRHDLENAGLRSRVLHKMASQLTFLAVDRNITVIATNQMTTKFDSTGRGHLTPALGTSWGHAPSFRLILDCDPSRSFRWATLIKSASAPCASAPYQVTKDGIRDIVSNFKLRAPSVTIVDSIVGTSFE